MPNVLHLVSDILAAKRAAARGTYVAILRRYDAPEPGDAEALIEAMKVLETPFPMADRDADRVREYRRLMEVAERARVTAESARDNFAAATEAHRLAADKVAQLNRARDPGKGKSHEVWLEVARQLPFAEAAALEAATTHRKAVEAAGGFKSLAFDLFAN